MCGALKLSGIVHANFRLNIAIAMLFLSLIFCNLGPLSHGKPFWSEGAHGTAGSGGYCKDRLPTAPAEGSPVRFREGGS